MHEIMVSAGEVSGDKNAAAVVRSLKEICKEVSFWGVGGTELSAEGMELLYNTVEKSSMGITEPLSKLGFYIKVYRDLKQRLQRRKPALILLVDFTAFNIRIARLANKLSIPALSYFSPSAWVWGRKRAFKMASWNTKIAAVFKMEYEAYKNAGAEVHFVGHPLPNEIKNRAKGSLENIGLNTLQNSNRCMIGILPGSRLQEVKKLLEVFLQAAALIYKHHPECVFVLPAATLSLRNYIEKSVKKLRTDIPLSIVEGRSLEVMENSKLIITAAGTSTLEAACLETLFISAHRLSLISHLFIKLFVKVKYMSLPNIILDRPVFPEFFQSKANVDNISEAALRMLEDTSYYNELKLQLKECVSRLGEENAALKTAKLIKEMLS